MPTALPPATDWTSASITEGQFKTAQTSLRSFLAGLLGTDGAASTALSTLMATFNNVVGLSGAYSVTSSDRGKVFHTGGTWTMSLPAVASIPAGFVIIVNNTGASGDVITLDPNLSELIEGAATLAVRQGQAVFVYSSGFSWRVIGQPAGVNGAYRTVQVFTASGTWTKPAGLVRLKVTVVGGGGGGCGGGTALSGGGSGGVAIKTLSESSVTGTVTVTVGGAGSGATSGTAGSGGTSSFGAYVSATGGTGGVNTALTIGTSGTGSGGDINVSGNVGSCCPPTAGNNAIGGPGFVGQYGAGGRANPGSGGAGAGGIVIVEEFY